MQRSDETESSVAVASTDAGIAALAEHGLFIIPAGRRDGFQASIHGHMLELADPADGRLAPSPDDLLVASIASDVAWTARSFLRAQALPDELSVAAKWETMDGHTRVADIQLTVTVSRRTEPFSRALAYALANSLARRSLAAPAIHISFEGVDE